MSNDTELKMSLSAEEAQSIASEYEKLMEKPDEELTEEEKKRKQWAEWYDSLTKEEQQKVLAKLSFEMDEQTRKKLGRTVNRKMRNKNLKFSNQLKSLYRNKELRKQNRSGK